MRLSLATTENLPWDVNASVFIYKHLTIMLRWSIAFFILALVAAIFGFGGLAAGFAAAAKVLFFVFVIGFLLTLVGQLLGIRR